VNSDKCDGNRGPEILARRGRGKIKKKKFSIAIGIFQASHPRFGR
jgi:hypothetical protein